MNLLEGHSTPIHAGASASSEVSADDYAGLIGRLHSMRVSFMGEHSGGSADTHATSTGTPNTGARSCLIWHPPDLPIFRD